MRDDFSAEVKRTVANRVNSICSNPSCRAVTSGPQIDPTKSVNVGVAAHITAASKGGARYDETYWSEVRSNTKNVIWLWQNCAKLSVTIRNEFRSKLIRDWKDSAELSASSKLGKAVTDTDASLAKFSREEIDLLCAAAENGEILLIRTKSFPLGSLLISTICRRRRSCECGRFSWASNHLSVEDWCGLTKEFNVLTASGFHEARFRCPSSVGCSGIRG